MKTALPRRGEATRFMLSAESDGWMLVYIPAISAQAFARKQDGRVVFRAINPKTDALLPAMYLKPGVEALVVVERGYSEDPQVFA